MSKGPWKSCPRTGISLRKLRHSDVPVTDDGLFDISSLPDCDVFNVASIASLCGFKDVAYFRDVVLARPDCPIHIHRIQLKDDATSRRNGTIYAAHTTSAAAGGKMWFVMRAREQQCRFDISSGSNI